MTALPPLQPLTRLQPATFETAAVLKKAVTAGRRLRAPTGLAASMPNQAILVNTLALQEAKDSPASDFKAALLDCRHRVRAGDRFYNQDLINNLFMHLYTRIDVVERDLNVSRLTATKCLDALAAAGFVQKVKVGRSKYCVNLALNLALNFILTREGHEE